jgi:hypothetical protein
MEWKSPIPRDIHFIWIGTQKVPDYFTKYFFKSFQENMPEFSFRLWTNKDLTKNNFPKTYSYIQKSKRYHGKIVEQVEENEDGTIEIYNVLDENNKPSTHNKWAQITDLMRLEIIYTYGGYYFDVNFEILPKRRTHTMFHLLNSTKKRFVGCHEVPFKSWDFLSNSFFGATKHNVILKRLLSKSYLNDIDYMNSDVSGETGPGYLVNGISSRDSYHIFPHYYFYPFYEDPKIVSFNSDTGKTSNLPIGRKVKLNRCHARETKKQSMKKLQKKKGFIEYPCKKYPRSYALKHWQLGRSWKTFA